MLQVAPKDFDVRPASTGKLTVNPADVTGLDANTNLISETRTVELLGEPPTAKWLGFQDWAIRAIHGHLASPALVVAESVGKANLCELMVSVIILKATCRNMNLQLLPGDQTS